MLVTALIAAFVLFFRLIDSHKLFHKLSASPIACICVEACVLGLGCGVSFGRKSLHYFRT